MQQIQYGRRSLKPLRLPRARPASCLLSQTGLRRHGNMLWRSTYWDSAGWQVTVLAVRVFGPLSPHKHPALSENLQHTAVYRAIEVCLCLRLNVLCVCVLVCVSLSAAEMLPKGLSHLITASDVPRLLYKFLSLYPETVSYFLLGLLFYFHFLTIYTYCCGLLPPHAERKF